MPKNTTTAKAARLAMAAMAAAAILPLPSCVVWNTGGIIQDRFITELGVDVDNPVDGKVYRVGEGWETKYYMLAPEITFHPCHPVVAVDFISADSKDLYPRGITPTGKQRWVEVEASERFYTAQDRNHRIYTFPEPNTPWTYKQDVGQLPAGAKLCLSGVKNRERRETFHYQRKGTAPLKDTHNGFIAQACAAPLNYIIDPVLDIPSNILMTAYVPFNSLLFDSGSTPSKGKAPQVESETLRGAELLRVSSERHKAPDGSYLYSPGGRWDEYGEGKNKRWDTGSFINTPTWATELHAFAPKDKEYVLYVPGLELPSDSKLKAMAAPLRAQGYKVTGAISGISWDEDERVLYRPIPE